MQAPALQLADLLGGAALVLSFGLLYQRRIGALINLYAWQGWALAAAAFCDAWTTGEADLTATGVITLATTGVAIPLALHHIVRRLEIRRAVDPALGIFPSLVLGAALVALSVMVALPLAPEAASAAPSLAREGLGLALSVVLLGFLVMVTRRNALAQVVGFLSLENGVILAAIGITGMKLVVEMAVAVLVMVAAVVFGVFFFRIRERFDSLDVAHLDRVGGLRG